MINSGVLLFDKAEGMTSFDAVAEVRRLYGIKQVGHTGTLDPMASGLLVMLLGKAAKAAEYISTDYKRYSARFIIGAEYDTGDITGKKISESDYVPDAQTVIDAALSFSGKSDQIPPMYSAIKMDGEKLYKLARKGITVERNPREIEIKDISCIPLSEREYSLEVTCSAGTYIRTLCEDICKKAGCLGAMCYLRRTEACGFDVTHAVTGEKLSSLTEAERDGIIIPTEELFYSLRKLTPADFFAHLLINGCNVLAKKLKTDASDGERFAFFDKDGFAGIAQAGYGREEKEEDKEQIYIRMIKLLR